MDVWVEKNFDGTIQNWELRKDRYELFFVLCCMGLCKQSPCANLHLIDIKRLNFLPHEHETVFQSK